MDDRLSVRTQLRSAGTLLLLLLRRPVALMGGVRSGRGAVSLR